MLRTLELLDRSKAIREYEVLDFKQGEDFYFLRIKAILSDNSDFISENMFLKKFTFIRIIGRIKMAS